MKKLFVLLVICMLIIVACSPTAPAAPTPSPVPVNPISPTSPSQQPAPGPSKTAVTINLSAQNMAFDTKAITVPAGASVTVVFDNKDKVSHNFALYTDKSGAKSIFVGELIAGPKSVTYSFTAPAIPGTYLFHCDPHASIMFGDFIVTSSGL
jgi:plastocyanin